MQPPPNYSNYYRQGPQNTGYPPAPAEVTFDSISVGWNVLKNDFGTFIGAILVAGLISYVLALPLGYLSSYIAYGSITMPLPFTWEKFARMEGITMFLSLPVRGISFMLQLGVANIALKKLEGQPTSIGDLFAPFNKFGSTFAAGMLYYLAILVGFILLIIPGIYLTGALAFMGLIVLRQDCGVAEALERSMKLLSGGRAFMMFLLLFVAGILSSIGICACGVGVLFTAPIAACTLAAAYYNFFPPMQPAYPQAGQVPQQGWTQPQQNWNQPPPSSEGPPQGPYPQ